MLNEGLRARRSGPVVTRLLVTPIKGLRMRDASEVFLAEHGALGDRDFFLIDGAGKLCSATRLGRLVYLEASWDPSEGCLRLATGGETLHEDGVSLGGSVDVDFFGHRLVAAHLVDGPWSALVSDVARRPLRLVKADVAGTASDAAPATLIGEASIAELALRAGVDDLDARRFRMLMTLSTCFAHEEDGWNGCVIHVGDAVLRGGGSVPRCAAITRDPDIGRRDAPLVSVLRDYRPLTDSIFGRGVPLGVYASIEKPGRIKLGDPVRVEPSRIVG